MTEMSDLCYLRKHQVTVEFSEQVWFVDKATSHLNLDLYFVPFKRVSENLKFKSLQY